MTNPVPAPSVGSRNPDSDDIEDRLRMATRLLVASAIDAERGMKAQAGEPGYEPGECYFCMFTEGHDDDPDCPMANLLVHANEVRAILDATESEAT